MQSWDSVGLWSQGLWGKAEGRKEFFRFGGFSRPRAFWRWIVFCAAGEKSRNCPIQSCVTSGPPSEQQPVSKVLAKEDKSYSEPHGLREGYGPLACGATQLKKKKKKKKKGGGGWGVKKGWGWGGKAPTSAPIRHTNVVFLKVTAVIHMRRKEISTDTYGEE